MPVAILPSMRDPFEDWWLDERFDSIGLSEEDVPATVEQYFARFDDDHCFELDDVRAVAVRLRGGPAGRAVGVRMLAQAIRDEVI